MLLLIRASGLRFTWICFASNILNQCGISLLRWLGAMGLLPSAAVASFELIYQRRAASWDQM